VGIINTALNLGSRLHAPAHERHQG
jgi:hypothetical protein